MKWFLVFWAGPVAFIGAWFGLSYYDINFGTFFFSRQMHDLVLQIYGKVLGVPPQEIPILVLNAILFDSLIVVGLVVLRKRKELRAWWSRRREPAVQEAEPEALDRVESLSNAP